MVLLTYPFSGSTKSTEGGPWRVLRTLNTLDFDFDSKPTSVSVSYNKVGAEEGLEYRSECFV